MCAKARTRVITAPLRQLRMVSACTTNLSHMRYLDRVLMIDCTLSNGFQWPRPLPFIRLDFSAIRNMFPESKSAMAAQRGTNISNSIGPPQTEGSRPSANYFFRRWPSQDESKNRQTRKPHGEHRAFPLYFTRDPIAPRNIKGKHVSGNTLEIVPWGKCIL
jgi:hypothetical protein